jgi:LPXTG-site transpeptidase (sortase) family protein
MKPNSQQRPSRTIDPYTAVGALLALIAGTALLTYAALTLPGKIAAAGGPPEEFLIAATRQAAPMVGATPTTTLTIDGTESANTTPLTNPTNEGVSDAGQAQSPGMSYQPTGTPNPFGDWPFTGDSDYWLTIQAINLQAPIIAFTPREKDIDGLTVLRLPVPNSFAVSWDARSAEPGDPGNTILSGHSNAYGGVFGDLDKLQVGNEVALWSKLGVFSYYVSSVQYIEEKDQPIEVRYQNAQTWLGQSADTRVTLITCWPQSDSSQRLIVVATR